MGNASDYWPGVGNGDGDDRLNHAADCPLNTGSEGAKFFAHLSRADLLENDYERTGVLGTGLPKLAIDDGKGMYAGSNIRNGNYGASQQLSDSELNKKHIAALYLNVSRPNHPSSCGANDIIGTLTVRQAKTIDKKIDDGTARAGRFQAYKVLGAIQGKCLDVIDGDYLLNNEKPACMGVYILDK